MSDHSTGLLTGVVAVLVLTFFAGALAGYALSLVTG